MPVEETPYVREVGYAQRYRDRRFRSGSGPRTHHRESRAILRLLAAADGSGTWLDVPCGTGRLSHLLPGRVVRADRALEMVAACDGAWPRVCASAAALPFRDGAFAGSLCLRLLHHIPRATERVAILTELARVTTGPVVASFFHSVSLQHLRRLVARGLGKTRSGRHAVTRRQFARDLLEAGLVAEEWRPLRRHVSEQWIVRARRR